MHGMDIEQGFNKGEKKLYHQNSKCNKFIKKINYHFAPKIPCCESLITDMSCQN